MMDDKQKNTDMTYMPDEATFKSGLQMRQLMGQVWRAFFLMSIVVAILALIVLFTNVINSAFGTIATTFEVDPVTLTGEDRVLSDLSEEELVGFLVEYVPNRMPVIVREYASQGADEDFTESTLRQLAPNGQYPDGYADSTVNEIRDLENTAEIFAEFISLNLAKSRIIFIVEEEIIALQVLDAWSLWDAMVNLEPSASEQERLDQLVVEIASAEEQIATLEQQIASKEDDVSALRDESTTENATEIRAINAEISTLQSQLASATTQLENLQDEQNLLLHANITTSVETDFGNLDTPVEIVRYHSWIDSRFLTDPMSSVPAQAGIRTAFIGSMIMMVIVILVSLPVGVAAAMYLEEYARDNFLAQLPKAVEARLAHVPMPSWLKNMIVGLTNINQLIETNVRNLAGVPSIIYGMLGLAIFVRLLAPFTSGVAFGLNVTPPPESRIVDLLQEPVDLGIAIELDDNYDITSYTGPEFMDEATAQNVVNLYRRLGTPSITNTGNVPLEETEREIANIFDINIVNDVPSDADSVDYSRVASGYIELDALPEGMTVEQFTTLGEQLRRITGFTVNGRTILSAALTLTLLILPLIIINSQEALRSVPQELREASYGLGATKWQTIWRTVLPASIPGIMTGAILAVSRAVGETAPLIVVGASTFLLTDPTGPFSQFTVLPIQIFQWTARPQGQFQFIAAAAIIVLLTLVLALNAVAIIIRNRFNTRY